jgi:hypothetical protein
MAARRFLFGFFVAFNLGTWLPTDVGADLFGLEYSVSKDGDAVTIDGETFPVAAIPKKEIEGEYGKFAQFTRGLALDGRSDKLISCSEMWRYKADYGGYPMPIDAAACVLEHDGTQENAILCSSVFKLNAVSYQGQTTPKRPDIIAFATKVCGGPEVKIIHQYDTPEVEYDGDRRGIFEMTGDGAHAKFAKMDSCEKGVYLPVGVANGDVSTGAICSTKRNGETVRIAVCTDEMVDHYKERVLADRSMTTEQLAIFTMVYCSGG